jgi:hypothetical protein
MATASDVLRIARGELGYDRHQDPEEGTKYGRWYAEKTGCSYFGTTGVPFCAMFASWCLEQAGVSCEGMPNASTTAIRNASGDARRGSVRDAQPGDVLLISWSCDDGDLDHTCLCEANCGDWVQTIEGNVNGGRVERRTRDWKYVRYAVAPAYGSEDTTTDEEDEVTSEDIESIAQRVYEKVCGSAGVWAYKNAGMNGDSDAYQLLTDIHGATADNGHDIWAYKNGDVNGDKDVYRLVTEIHEAVCK